MAIVVATRSISTVAIIISLLVLSVALGGLMTVGLLVSTVAKTMTAIATMTAMATMAAMTIGWSGVPVACVAMS